MFLQQLARNGLRCRLGERVSDMFVWASVEDASEKDGEVWVFLLLLLILF